MIDMGGCVHKAGCCATRFLGPASRLTVGNVACSALVAWPAWRPPNNDGSRLAFVLLLQPGQVACRGYPGAALGGQSGCSASLPTSGGVWRVRRACLPARLQHPCCHHFAYAVPATCLLSLTVHLHLPTCAAAEYGAACERRASCAAARGRSWHRWEEPTSQVRNQWRVQCAVQCSAGAGPQPRSCLHTWLDPSHKTHALETLCSGRLLFPTLQ